jgi:hypothetical protein
VVPIEALTHFGLCRSSRSAGSQSGVARTPDKASESFCRRTPKLRPPGARRLPELTPTAARALGLDELGIKRFIRDVIKSPGFVTSGRSGLRVEVAPEAAYFNKLSAWKPQIDLPLYLSETQGILYKN